MNYKEQYLEKIEELKYENPGSEIGKSHFVIIFNHDDYVLRSDSPEILDKDFVIGFVSFKLRINYNSYYSWHTYMFYEGYMKIAIHETNSCKLFSVIDPNILLESKFGVSGLYKAGNVVNDDSDYRLRYLPELLECKTQEEWDDIQLDIKHTYDYEMFIEDHLFVPGYIPIRGSKSKKYNWMDFER